MLTAKTPFRWMLVLGCLALVPTTAALADVREGATGLPGSADAPVPLNVDNDGDGSFTPDDCNDTNPNIFPGAPELCNGLDDDCDGQGDEDFPTLGDACTNGVGECEASGILQCSGDQMSTACDAVPGTPTAEICDGLDNDCNGFDDFGNPGVGGQEIDGDNDGALACDDCDDADDQNFPGNPEVCDGADNDCDGAPDNGIPDDDGDGIGNPCDACPLDPGGLTEATPWDQGFETDAGGWFDGDDAWNGAVTRLVSGTDGIASSSGGFHANFAQGDDVTSGTFLGPFSRFDGYRSFWPGGWSALVDIYLDTAWTPGEGFDYSVAANGQDGAHQRDFIFHVTQDTTSGTILVGASNNTNFDPREDLETINHVAITTSGWYTFRHVFRDDGGVLAVDLQLLDSGGTLLFTETRSDPSDSIATEVGGNRYGWFTNIDIAGGIEVDNHRLTLVAGDSDGDGVCDSDDICPGGDDAVDGDSDGVPAFCDCDDADAANFPGNAEICDGQDNDCSASTQTAALSQGGWFSDDTRADGTGTEAAGTNLVSDTLTDQPEASGGTSTHDADIQQQIVFGTPPTAPPAGTWPFAVNLNIAPAVGAGKSQISHRIDDGTGHAPGSVFGPGFSAEYSWLGTGTASVSASLKFGIKTAEFGSAGVSSRTGENVWDKVLIYEPGNLNGGVSDGTWYTETIDYTSGRWWFFDRVAVASTIGAPMTLSDMSTSGLEFTPGKTAADVYALITAPGAHITSVQFGIGSGNAGGNVWVNQLVTNFYRSGDRTVFGGPAIGSPGADFPGETIDLDGDLSLSCNDCDDTDAAVFPGAPELCDGKDNDCNGLDDFGDPGTGGLETDDDGDGQSECQGDCDDADPANFAGNAEVCDGQDNDCNGLDDFGDPGTDGLETDDDGDGQSECLGDCDDAEPAAFDGNLEVCGDGIDNDCDGTVDAGGRFVATTGSDAGNDCTDVGAPCLTIQHAIDQACDGDTVSVAAGTYPEALDIDRPVSLQCANQGIPWDGVRGPETVLSAVGLPVAVDLSVGSVSIDGCEIVGDASTWAGILMFDDDDVDIENVAIANNLVHGMALANPFASFQQERAAGVFGVMGAPGSRNERIRNLSIAGNRFFDIGAGVGGSGVYLNNVDGGTSISGNSFDTLGNGPSALRLGSGIGIDAIDDTGAPSSGLTIAGNRYASVFTGVGVLATSTTVDEDHADFTDVPCFVLSVGDSGLFGDPPAVVNETLLAPYARTDLPTGFGALTESFAWYATIQAAVDGSDATADIDVTAGTFVEQVDVPKSLRLLGSGSATTTISTPPVLAADPALLAGPFTLTRGAIVTIHGSGTDVEFTGFTVAGPNPGGAVPLVYGILVRSEAHANVHDNLVRDIRDEPFTGAQRGIAIAVGSSAVPAPATADIVDNVFVGYQKNGPTVDHVGSSATISGNTITGAGPTPLIAQNGIQISRGAVGVVSGNTVAGHQCDVAVCGPDPLADTQSIGILLFDAAGGVAISNNDVDDNDIGILSFTQGTTTITDNRLSGNRYEGLYLDEGTAEVLDNEIDGGNVPVIVTSFSGAASDSIVNLQRNVVTGALETGVRIVDTDGADTVGPLVTANFNHIFGNADGADNTSGVPADATCNWWGAADGPGPIGPGSGDTVSADLDVSSWLLAADFGLDTDSDGFGSCNDPGVVGQGDCLPSDPNTYPGAPEICDRVDNDCDGVVPFDEIDDDLDTFTECEGDCDDVRNDVFPGAPERCDDTLVPGSQVDHDCDTTLNGAGTTADDDCAAASGNNVCQLDSCEADDTCGFAASGVCGVAGEVLYNLVTSGGPPPAPGTDSPDPSRPIEDFVISLTGFPDETTDSAGTYGFSSVAGTVTVGADKAADANDLTALSGLDSALIAQFSVGLVGLSPFQLVVADVSDNNAVTSFDASLVAQKTVDPIGFDFPVAGDWTCMPTSVEYDPIAADEGSTDFVCALYGDVSMSWTPAAFDGTASAETGEGAQFEIPDHPTEVSFEPRSEAAVLYLARSPQTMPDGSVVYVLGLQNADGILGIDIALIPEEGSVALLEATGFELASGFQTLKNDRSGEDAVALFGLEPMQGTGGFLRLVVRADGAVAGFPYEIKIQANEGLIPIVLGPGLRPVTGGASGGSRKFDMTQNTAND